MNRSSQHEARKKDTREKIQLGGLIVKAGLRWEKRALLLGILIDAATADIVREHLPAVERDRLTALGTEAFGDDPE